MYSDAAESSDICLENLTYLLRRHIAEFSYFPIRDGQNEITVKTNDSSKEGGSFKMSNGR